MRNALMIAASAIALWSYAGPMAFGAPLENAPKANNGEQAVPLANRGFEQNFKGWRLREGAASGVYHIGSGALGGTHSAEIVIKADSPQKLREAAYLSRDDLPTAVGDYRLSFLMRTDLQSGRAGVRVVARSDADRLPRPVAAQTEVPSISGKTAWTEYSFTYRLPKATQMTALQLQATEAIGTVAFGDVRLTQISVAAEEKAMPKPNAEAVTGPRQLQFPLKSARMIYSDTDISRARANIEKYPSAREMAAKVRQAADYWVTWSDDELTDLVTSSSVPRATNLSEVGCPVHGNAIHEKFGTYPWIIDPKVPLKVKCPIGGELYPSNDYETYYKSGFKEKKGWDTKYVDDGWGWVNPANGERYWFVAYANEWTWYSSGVMTKGIGTRSVGTAVRDLSHAYLLTGDRRYAHKAASLLYKIGQVYPAMDYSKQSHLGKISAAQGQVYRGKVVKRIWETALATVFAAAYDIVWETIDTDSELQRSTKQTGEQIRAFIEANVLEEAIDSYFNGRIQGNFGTHQNTLAHLALSRQYGDNKKYFEKILADPGDSIPYTGLNYALYNFVFRDGMPYESPGYNALWIKKISDMAYLLKKADIDLYELPKLRKLYDGVIDIVNIGQFTPSIGDTGSVYGSVKGQDDVFREAFNVYGDQRYAQWLAGFGAAGEGGFQTFESLFEPPVELKSPAPAGRILSPQPTRLLAGYGLGILNNRADTASVTLTYGFKGSHSHADRLNVDFFAFGHPMMPDLGYPDGVNVRAKGTYTWTKNTVAHNTVVVDASKQSANPPSTVHLFADSPFARVIDVDANGVYPQATTYRRNLLMVDAGEGRHYYIDTFTVNGGRQHDYSLHGPPGKFEAIGATWTPPAKGTLAGENVAVGDIYDDPDLMTKGNKMGYPNYSGSGFQHLINVQRSTGGSSILQYTHANDPQVQLRVRVLGQPGQELILANARVSPVRQKELLKYIIARRKAADGQKDLSSQFVSVIEPFTGKPTISGVEQLTLDGGTGVALAMRRADGMTDVVLNDAAGSRKTLKQYALETDAKSAVVTLDAQGQVQRVFFAAGTYLALQGKRYDAPSPIAGQVVAVDPVTRTVRVRLESTPSEAAVTSLAGSVVHFQNALRRTEHPIEKASLEGGDLVLKTYDALQIGRTHLTDVKPAQLTTDSILPLAPTYRGASLADEDFKIFREVREVVDGRIQLTQPLPPNSNFKAGQDAWIVNIGLSDRMEVTPVFHWER